MKKKITRYLKLLLSLIVTLFILYLIYRKINFAEIKTILYQSKPVFLIFYLGFLLLQYFFVAWRWKIMVTDLGEVKMDYFTSLRHVLGSNSANLVIPGKMGELIKGYWIRKKALRWNSFWLVIMEKIWDVAIVFAFLTVFLTIFLVRSRFQQNQGLLLIWGVCLFLSLIGLLFLKRITDLAIKLGIKMIRKIKKEKENDSLEKAAQVSVYPDKPVTFVKMVLLSIVIWSIQIFQFHFIFKIFGINIPFIDLYTGIPMALLTALFPFSIGGIGPRDAVIVWFFSSYASIEVLMSVGILAVARVVVPALLGVPFFIIEMNK